MLTAIHLQTDFSFPVKGSFCRVYQTITLDDYIKTHNSARFSSQFIHAAFITNGRSSTFTTGTTSTTTDALLPWWPFLIKTLQCILHVGTSASAGTEKQQLQKQFSLQEHSCHVGSETVQHFLIRMPCWSCDANWHNEIDRPGNNSGTTAHIFAPAEKWLQSGRAHRDSHHTANSLPTLIQTSHSQNIKLFL